MQFIIYNNLISRAKVIKFQYFKPIHIFIKFNQRRPSPFLRRRRSADERGRGGYLANSSL